MRTFVYLVFYFFVTTEIIQQVWKIKNVNSKAILGMIAGYISLGLVGFFFLSFVYAIDHESFSTLASPNENLSLDYVQDKLLYFSFITLLTIGYGDMIPLTPIAQKTTIFIGLSGQMYLTIITAIVVGKFLNKKKD
jgi:voltage-gated potassium channel Kch